MGSTQPPTPGVPGLFPGEESGRDVKLTTHLHFVLRIRMSGVTPLFHLHAFIAWTRKTLLLLTSDITDRGIIWRIIIR